MVVFFNLCGISVLNIMFFEIKSYADINFSGKKLNLLTTLFFSIMITNCLVIRDGNSIC